MTEPNAYPVDAETRGWAHVGRTLSFCILTLLRKRGIISDADAEFTLDQALMSLEGLQMQNPDDQSLLVAREAVQAMIDVLPASPPNRQ